MARKLKRILSSRSRAEQQGKSWNSASSGAWLGYGVIEESPGELVNYSLGFMAGH
jgi:hypothetical protein